MPAGGPPVAGGLLRQLEAQHTRGPAIAAAPGLQGQAGEALQLGQGQIRIAGAHQAEAAVGQAPQLGGQAEIGAEPVEGVGGADQLLVGGGHPGAGAVHIRQQAARAVGHGDAPDAALAAEQLHHPLLEGGAADLGLQHRHPGGRRQLGQAHQRQGPLGAVGGQGRLPADRGRRAPGNGRLGEGQGGLGEGHRGREQQGQQPGSAAVGTGGNRHLRRLPGADRSRCR